VVTSARALSRHLHGNADDIAFRRGAFWYHRGQTIYKVDEADSGTRTLHGVGVFELDAHGRLIRSIRAQSVQVEEGGRWSMEDATVRRFDPDDPSAPPVVETLARTSLEVGGRSELALLDARADTLSLRDLREYIATRSKEGTEARRSRALLHARLSDPISVFVFTLLAVPLGLRVEDTKSLAVPALQGVVLLMLFFFARSLAATLATQDLLPVAAGPWSVVGLFGGYGTWRLARSPR
jgi:lipopolysaccharide export LptBFGC system permease protein LptF